MATLVRPAVESGDDGQKMMCMNNLANKSAGTGNGDDNTIVVDLKHFKQFSMDEASWVATLGAGHLLGDVTKKLLANGGRAMARGTCPQVGTGEHATVGGLGPMSRMRGGGTRPRPGSYRRPCQFKCHHCFSHSKQRRILGSEGRRCFFWHRDRIQGHHPPNTRRSSSIQFWIQWNTTL